MRSCGGFRLRLDRGIVHGRSFIRSDIRIIVIGDARFARLPATTMVMHPGPMNRGLEIAARAADSSQSTVREQVANGVSVRMAALYLLLSGERGEAR